MLREEGETAEVQHLVAVLIDKLEDLLHETLCAFVLDVAFGRGEESAHGIHVDAALNETRTRPS